MTAATKKAAKDQAEHELHHTEPTVHSGSKLQQARDRLAVLTQALEESFPERSRAVRALLGAVVAGENVLMLGPPGTAKSALARAVANGVDGFRFFETLCSKFQQPEEVFGPISLRALTERDEQVRKTDGYMPDSDVLFLDEVFKGSSAMLNALLWAINERLFRNGDKVVTIPLRSVIAASNELPHEDDNLAAFHDRFVVRVQVGYLEHKNLARLVRKQLPKPPRAVMIAPDFDILRAAAEQVEVTEECAGAVASVVERCRSKGVDVSDRRAAKAADILRAHATIAGLERVTSAHMEPLLDVLWSKPEQRPVVKTAVEEFTATWIKVVRELRAAVDEQIAKVQRASSTDKGEALLLMGGVLKAEKQISERVGEERKRHPEAKAEFDAAGEALKRLKEEIKAAGRKLELV